MVVQSVKDKRFTVDVEPLLPEPLRYMYRFEYGESDGLRAAIVWYFFLKPLVFEVQYQDIINRPDAYRTKEDLFRYQWSTKAKEWAYEQEVRLVVKEPSAIYAAYTPEQAKMKKKEWDWREIHHYMPLKGECFEEIYFGVKIDDKEKSKIINFARTKLNPEIKLYKMNIDESAFRLKAKAVD